MAVRKARIFVRGGPKEAQRFLARHGFTGYREGIGHALGKTSMVRIAVPEEKKRAFYARLDELLADPESGLLRWERLRTKIPY